MPFDIEKPQKQHPICAVKCQISQNEVLLYSYLVLEFAGISAAYGHHTAIHVQLTHDRHRVL